MNRAQQQRYEEHQRRVDEIIDNGWAAHRRNMWRRFMFSAVGGTVSFVVIGGLLGEAVRHVPWSWEEAGLRAVMFPLAYAVFWACLMWWDYRTSPLRRR